MTAQNKDLDQEVVRKDLLRYILQQVKEEKLAKADAVNFLKLLDQKDDNPTGEPIAIVGIACRFPDANDKESFWENLKAGRNSIKDFPEARRKELTQATDEELPLFRGGFLDRVDEFDAEFFGVAPQVAHHMDPYHRLMLEVLVESIEDAGYQHSELYGKQVGVFVGNDHAHRMVNNYLDFIEMPKRDFNSMTGSWSALLAGRLSYTLNLRGPAQVVDTSCSSGLVALDAAVKALAQNDCESALVGAINLMFLPIKNVVGEVENQESQVWAFDERASGTVWGEGVASVMLKPLSKAKRDGDSIYGVLKGIAVNSDGASNGITAPSSRAQQEVLLKTWQRAKVNPENISYIEAHGTGTHLGDPIELKGLSSAFSKSTNRKQFCGLGSVKTNIGHTVGVSGLASMIKVLLGFKHQQMPPSLNFQTPNQFVDFCNSPIFFNDVLRSWEAPSPRIAGVNSFGLSGTNCHLLLQEYVEEGNASEAGGQDTNNETTGKTKQEKPNGSTWTDEGGRYYALPISARTSDLLDQTVQRYLEFLKREPATSLADFCFTASVGRPHYPERVIILANSISQLTERLQQLVILLRSSVSAGNTDGIYRTTASRSQAKQSELSREANALLDPKLWPALAELATIAQLYVDGAQIKWEQLFKAQNFKRLHLPAQPFIKQRFWFKDNQGAKKAANKLTVRDLTEESSNNNPKEMYRVARVGESIKLEQSSVEQNDPIKYVGAQVVAYVVCDTLGYDKISLSDNYYAMGGDSISGTRIIYILNEMLDLHAELSDILATESLAEFIDSLQQYRDLDNAIEKLEQQQDKRLDERLDKQSDKKIDKQQASIQSGPSMSVKQANSTGQIIRISEADYYSLSRAQRRMYMQTELDPNATTYNATALIELAQEPVMEKEQEILQKLVDRHESLRTRFELHNGTPVQKIVKTTRFTPIYLDRSDREGELQEILQNVVEECVKPFDLLNAPLLRVVFIKVRQRHFMLIDMHHIISDGASVGIFIQEYMGLKNGDTLKELPITYKDFAASDLAQVETQKYQTQAKHWLERFKGDIPIAELDTDFPRPAARDFSGATLHTKLTRQELAALQQLAIDQGCSLFVVLMSAFRVLLAKYGAGHDLTIGTPVSGRNNHQTHGLIGMFVNTLALRDTVNDDESFSQLLARVKSNTLKDFDNQDYAYEELIDALNQTHIPDRNPLFDICLVLQNQDMGLSTEGALQDVQFDAGIAKFELTAFCRVNGNELEISWEYATALFASQRIERLATHFKQLLSVIAASPDRSIVDMDFYTEKDKEDLLRQDLSVQGNSVPNKPEIDSSISDLFSSQATLHPKNTAAIYGEQSIDYAELNKRSNQIAHHLAELGVGRGDAIALWYKPGFEMVATILGVLKAGAAYVPLDFANPIDRTELILKDCAAKLLLTNSLDSLPLDSELKVIETDKLDFSSYSSEELAVKVSGDDVAYIMYTSGTTGKPKGALIRHKSVIRVVKNTNYLHLKEDDVCLLLSNYAFDGCVPDLYGALLNGAKVILTNKDDILDSEKIGRLITEHKVTSMFVTTALFNLLVEQQLQSLSSLKNIMFGGEAVSFKHVEKAFHELGKGKLIHVYGPTETTVFATALIINELMPAIKNVPIGYPINQTSLYILDKHLKPVPYGTTGELYVGGDGLALGYLNRTELTAERFIENPFVSGEKLYKTGDLVRKLDDGSLLYVGRIDSQVKIRGFRIELSEVENVLASLPQVSRAIVIDFTRDSKKYLAAYVVLEKDDNTTAKSLRKSLAETLPDYMLPDSFTFIDAIPLNANGKIDRRRLPEPVLDSLEQYVAPTNKLEADLCDVWQKLLGVNKVGIEDNFFQIGGDSITGIQLVSQLRQAGYSLQVKDIFASPTISQLALWLGENKSKVDYVAEQGSLEGSFSLSPYQKYLSSIQNLKSHYSSKSPEEADLLGDGINILSCQVSLVPVTNNTQEEALTDALNALIEHHDLLRASLDLVKEITSYDAKSKALVNLERVEVSGLKLSELDLSKFYTEYQNWKSTKQSDLNSVLFEPIENAISKQNLSHTPHLSAIYFMDQTEKSNLLCLLAPHLICDTQSLQIIAQDCQKLLSGEPLEAKTSSYRQWVNAIADYDQERQTQKDYWQQVASQPRPKLQLVEEEIHSYGCNYPSELFTQANQGYRTTNKELLLSALAITLKQVFGNKLNVIRLEEQDREAIFESVDFSRTVGCFVRNYPVVLNARQNTADTIIQTKEMLRSIPIGGAGFEYGFATNKLVMTDEPSILVSYLDNSRSKSNASIEKDASFTSFDLPGLEKVKDVGLFIETVLEGDEMKLTIKSHLNNTFSLQIFDALKSNIQAVVESGKQTANLGGEVTPSDFEVEALSMSRLQRIQNKLSSQQADKNANKKQTNKRKMKI